MREEAPSPLTILGLTSRIVVAYLSNNAIPLAELPEFIRAVHRELTSVSSPSEPQAEATRLPIPIRKSITPDYLVSFEDGKQYRSLKRHLAARGLTPDAYRAKWGLPGDYPMVAPSFSRRRAEIARTSGLGRAGAREASPQR